MQTANKVQRNGMTFAAAMIAAAILIACSGCASTRSYTRGEKVAACGYWVGAAVDTVSTYEAVTGYDNLCEGNPLYSDLDDGQLLASMLVTKTIGFGIAYAVGEWRPDWRIGAYSFLGGAQMAAGLNNFRIINECGEAN